MSEIIYLAAGCFWSVEYRLSSLPGVLSTQVGYAGGVVANPTYETVCSGTSGHTETVKVEFDPGIISLQQILAEFFSLHDPTQFNRQGPDVGTQYRSAVFFHDSEQEDIAKRNKDELDKSDKFSQPIVTEIIPAQTFYRAEEYHQEYLFKRGKGSCGI